MRIMRKTENSLDFTCYYLELSNLLMYINILFSGRLQKTKCHLLMMMNVQKKRLNG